MFNTTSINVREKSIANYGDLNTINPLYGDINGDDSGEDEERPSSKRTKDYDIAPKETNKTSSEKMNFMNPYGNDASSS
jgi:hypothetical protein